MGESFLSFCESFQDFFRCHRRSLANQACQYLCGLMQALRSNMERMAEVVPQANSQALQHFLSVSNWDYKAVIREVAQRVDALLGDSQDRCLVIDETGIPKKGTKSVGVARQWFGQLGKVDNCQVGVFAALVLDCWVCLVDFRLYLPKGWTDCPERCHAAGVPEEAQVSKTKPELALEMVREARANGLRFQWIAADGLYGKDGTWLRALDAEGEIFMADVHRDQRVYLEDPAPMVPAGRRSRGRPRTRRVAQSEKIRLDKWAESQPESSWQRVSVRHSTRGLLEIEVLHRRVWLWDGREEEAFCWHALVSREVNDPTTLKWGLSNAPADTSAQRLAQMQRQRYWIERVFQDAKQEAGFGDYQARGWKAWNHRMALVMMAMLFMLRQRIEHQETVPLLSCTDIKVLLIHFLPRRATTVAEVLRQMEFRHQQREASIESAYRRKRRREGGTLK